MIFQEVVLALLHSKLSVDAATNLIFHLNFIWRTLPALSTLFEDAEVNNLVAVLLTKKNLNLTPTQYAPFSPETAAKSRKRKSLQEEETSPHPKEAKRRCVQPLEGNV